MKKGVILVVEDEERIRRMLNDFFNSCQYEVLEAENGRKALEVFYANNSKIDIILLDVMLPYMDGFEVLSTIREVSLVPIIMVTAKGEEYDQLYGFKQGADDYISKPFSPTILLAHIEAVLKRCGNNEKKEKLKLGNVEVDEETMIVHVCDEVVELTPKEYDLLVFLMKNEKIVLNREKILNSVWNYDYTGDTRTVDTHVKQIRAKLTNKCNYIKTVHGIGYRFEVD